MYYIYHIPGVKVGCTNNIERRIKQQGCPSYEILEEHSDIILAAIREKELNIKFNYDWNSSQDYLVITEVNRKGTNIAKELNKKKIIAISLDDNSTIDFNSIKECSEILGIDAKMICRVLKNKRKSTHNYKFNYKIK